MQLCRGCGARSHDFEQQCPYCGSPLPNAKSRGAGPDAQRTRPDPGAPPHRQRRTSAGSREPLQMFRPRRYRMAAAVLALVTGFVGGHWFYLERTGRGLACACFFWTGIPFILGIVDFAKFLTMSEEEFHYRFG